MNKFTTIDPKTKPEQHKFAECKRVYLEGWDCGPHNDGCMLHTAVWFDVLLRLEQVDQPGGQCGGTDEPLHGRHHSLHIGRGASDQCWDTVGELHRHIVMDPTQCHLQLKEKDSENMLFFY